MMASEIVLLVTEQRNRQRILLPAAKAPCSFGRGPRCDYVLAVHAAVPKRNLAAAG